MSLSVSVWHSIVWTCLLKYHFSVSPSIAPWAGADLWSCRVPVFQRRLSSSGFYAFHVSILQSPLATTTDSMTSLLCSYFILHGGRLPTVSQLNFCLLFKFLPPVKPSQGHSCATQSRAPVADSWLPGCESQPLALGRALAWHRAAPLLPSVAAAPAMALTEALHRMGICKFHLVTSALALNTQPRKNNGRF